jgi:hypothetical protein
VAVFYATTVGCYFCLKTTAGRRAALTVSLMLGAYQPFLNAVGWDYVDGPGVAYFLLACACGTAAIQRTRPLLWATLSGASAAACVFTNLAWLMLMPGLVLYLAWLSSDQPVAQRARLAGALVAGAIAVAVVCALVFASITGHYFFFLPSITASRVLVSQPNPWQSATYDWVWTSALLGTASATYLLSLIAVVRGVARGDRRTSLVPYAIWLWTLPVMLLVQLSGTPVLQLRYYVSYLIPGLTLAAGALMAAPLQRMSPRAFAFALAIATAAWMFVFAASMEFQPFGDMARFVVAAAIVMLAAIACRVSSTSTWPVAAGLACVFLLLIVHRDARVGEPGERESSYRATVDAFARLRPMQMEKPFYFWYSNDAPRVYQSVYQSIASCYLWGYRLFSARYPARTTPGGSDNQPQSGQRIVLMTERPQALNEVEDRLGAGIRVVHQEHVARDRLEFTLLVFDVR